jgi:hypothetical protein
VSPLVSLPGRDQIASLLESTLVTMVEGHNPSPPVTVQDEIKLHLDALVAKGQHTVRDGILTLLAMELAYGELIDWGTQRLHNPARSASRFLGSDLYPKLHIAGSPEALQTGVKGTGTYLDRSNETWKSVLRWASDQKGLEPVEAAFLYLASKIAATARALPDLPELDTPRLTFGRVLAVVDGMLGRPSGGAHEQLIYAAFLGSWRQQLDLPGFVETKHVNAADAAAGTAADVQVKQGGQVVEAYEITSEQLAAKIDQASRTLRNHDLRRIHVLAKGTSKLTAEKLRGFLPRDADISALDIREEIRSLVARSDKPHRRDGLETLYALLIEKQPDDGLVKEYVKKLFAVGLTVDR